ncbi:MAG: TfoX/Sxy family protein [Gammaproteobacteria bacterium]|nr:TfoX/Sxy family protein [Gammaproteobacteria bacterium]
MGELSAVLPKSWEECRNIGPRSAVWLRVAGLDCPLALLEIGPVGSYLAVRASGVDASLNLLWALAGAMHDCHWAALDPGVREGLLREMDARMEFMKGDSP